MAKPNANITPGRLDRDIYSTKEFCDAAGLNRETVFRAIHDGELKAINVGGSGGFKILHEDAIAWLKLLRDRNSAQPQAEPKPAPRRRRRQPASSVAEVVDAVAAR